MRHSTDNQNTDGAPRRTRNILVVDDAESVAEFMREVLIAFEHNADISLNVEEALRLFEKGKYDLVVTDYNMPGMSGVEFARAIRKRNADQRILLITGDLVGDPRSSGGTKDFNATLQKPFTLTEFQETLTGLFGSGNQASH